MERNQTPMMSPPTLDGASFVMALNPTGLRQSSPTVCSKYTSVSHQGLTPVPPATGMRMANPRPTNSNPQENLVVLVGSFLPMRTHSHANTGASAMMKTELND